MAGTYDRGSLVFAREVPVAELEVGDVITYVPPRKEALVTHRITKVSSNAHGVSVFRTKGDANERRDPWTFRLDEAVQARVEAAVPYLGYPIAALSIRAVRIAVIGLPALLIAAVMIARLWRASGRLHAPHDTPQASASR
jgi:signal peptidase